MFLLLFKYSCLHFPPTVQPRPTHPHIPPMILSLLALPMCPLYMFIDGLSPIIPLPPLSLITVSLLFISMSLVLFCLFV